MRTADAFWRYLRNSLRFQGRASRQECFVVHVLAVSWVLCASYVSSTLVRTQDGEPTALEVLSALPAFLGLWPLVAVAQRRGNDAGLRYSPFAVLVFGYGGLVVVGVALFDTDQRSFIDALVNEGGDPRWFEKLGSLIALTAYIVLLSRPSHPGQNRHGPQSLEAGR